MHPTRACRNCLWSWNCSFSIMMPPHSYPVIQFLFLIFVLCTIPYFSHCPEVHVCVIEGCHVSWKVVRPLREKQCVWIAGGLARVAARQLPASHQRGADDIPSDKSVKGEESTLAPPSKKGKVKANEQDSGHSGAETMWNGSVKDGPQRRSRGKWERCKPGSYWHRRHSVSRTIFKFLRIFWGGRQEIRE